MKKILILCFLFAAALPVWANVVMRGNYYAHHQLGEDATPAEKTAREELLSHLRLVFGRITGPEKNIYIGRSPHCIRRFGKKRLDALGEEEFLIESDNKGNIYITGGRPRGTLYGVYYFLDRLVGIRWYTPDFTYIPKLKKLELGTLKIHEKPKFVYRCTSGGFVPHRYSGHRPDPRWAARNLYNNTNAAHHRQHVSDEFGGEYLWSLPLRCHGMIELIPSKIYFKTNPEFFAIHKGKRVGRGVASDYCLSNPALLEETVKRIRYFMKKMPGARMVSVQEGDYTVAPCECKGCQALLKKYVNESGMWLDFTNRVAEKLEKEFPDVIFVTFAYDRTQKPPQNIKARHNVGVQICAWGISRGVPYDDSRNTYRGKKFVDNVIKPWSRICKNLVFWDYIFSPGYFSQDPNPMIQVQNMQMFSRYTKLGVFNENGLGEFLNGQPFKSFLMGRLEWNPFNVDAVAEHKLFCDRYYGKGGKYIFEYWKNLRDVNEKQGFCNILLGGTIGKIPAEFESFETTMKSYQLYLKALNATKDSKIENARVRNAFIGMQYHILLNYKKWKKDLQAHNINIDDVYQALIKRLEEIDAEVGTADSTERFIGSVKKLYSMRNINASASNYYGNSIPERAYDGNLKTYYHGGVQRSWCQREFDDPVEIKRLITVLAGKNNLSCTYKITGSLDGKTWFDVVKESKAIQKDSHNYLFADDTLPKPVKVKFLRTTVWKVILPQNRINDATLHEQFINPTELPKGLIRK